MFKFCLEIFVIVYVLTTVKGQYDISPEYSATVSQVFLGEPLDKAFQKVGNKAYHFGQSKVSWHKALLICRSIGGHLASIDNKTDHKDLANYLTSSYGTGRTWWLSGSDVEAESDFYWYSTGSRIGYAEWAQGQPDDNNNDEDCVYLDYRRSYEMYDGKCDRKMYYICENRLKTIIVNVS